MWLPISHLLHNNLSQAWVIWYIMFLFKHKLFLPIYLHRRWPHSTEHATWSSLSGRILTQGVIRNLRRTINFDTFIIWRCLYYLLGGYYINIIGFPIKTTWFAAEWFIWIRYYVYENLVWMKILVTYVFGCAFFESLWYKILN
jgi:hypothetical protein